ncbi:hypothetical protein AAF712_001389 [Marasmius tenuissimus]|uniref:Late embryogenesis abundant protein n=1 Tax=Marasmius tenuissimus TaxID=585030 RepID=A0ABR3AG20_9AGAR|nr:hypothetical protein PM082_012908 [Marasmius tenuissimus]
MSSEQIRSGNQNPVSVPNEIDVGQAKTYSNLDKQQHGVVEARPGIIESSNIDPLNENSNKDDGWANATSTTNSGESMTSKATNMASDTVNKAKEMLTGSERK